MDVKFIDSLTEVSSDDWQHVFRTLYPFTQYAFLSALEVSECIQSSTGWRAQHIVVKKGDKILALMPCYIKGHSYGEYVFDWAWADAYHQNGLSYYPKLVTAIPFTPSTGPRLAFDASIQTDTEKAAIFKAISLAIQRKLSDENLSSWHVLFPDKNQSAQLQACQAEQRVDLQYHWFNKSYVSFEDFLARFKSRKRKNIRKEREAIERQGILMQRLEGAQITPEVMTIFIRFYQATYLKRSGHRGYLNPQFFMLILVSMSNSLLMVCAFKDKKMIAAALFFKGQDSLYGRYWGCEQAYHFLHFETCYYQGIEYCIDNNLQHFDPGAQGEHKISRGFEPTKTFSNHIISNPNFRLAINDFIQQEQIQTEINLSQLCTLLPFKTEL